MSSTLPDDRQRSPLHRVSDLPKRLYAGYDEQAEQPLPVPAYGVLALTFLATFTLGTAAVARRGDLRSLRAPEIVLVGVATHKLTRLLTKDWVTSFIRAPFTRYEESEAGGEVREASRGTGMQRAMGDLLTCQFCTGPWVAGALSLGMLAAPRPTRLVAGVLASETISDWLHLGYERARRE